MLLFGLYQSRLVGVNAMNLAEQVAELTAEVERLRMVVVTRDCELQEILLEKNALEMQRDEFLKIINTMIFALIKET